MELANRLLSHLFPSRCILCQRTVASPAKVELTVDAQPEICAECYLKLPHNDSYCVRCALPLAQGLSTQLMCGRCINKTPAFDYAYSLFRYEDDIINLVHQLKFSEKITYARSIGELLAARLQGETSKTEARADCLLPVPLHGSRIRQRGFNQSIEIARIVADRLQIVIEYDAVVRQRSTESQAGLNAEQRRKNIKGAFKLRHEINYKHVLIVDDVVTTGSTVNELAKLLKKANVERVGVLSIARAPVKT